jgi:hypothetical protein
MGYEEVIHFGYVMFGWTCRLVLKIYEIGLCSCKDNYKDPQVFKKLGGHVRNCYFSGGAGGGGGGGGVSTGLLAFFLFSFRFSFSARFFFFSNSFWRFSY